MGRLQGARAQPLTSAGFSPREQGRAEQQRRKPLPQPPFAEMGREPLTHPGSDGASKQEWHQKGKTGRGPVTEGGEGPDGVDRDQ